MIAGTDIVFDGGFTDWKRAAREALAANLAPDETRWIDTSLAQGELALAEPPPSQGNPSSLAAPSRFRVPREFLDLAADVACHREPSRWALLYRALWRLTHGDPNLLANPSAPETHALHALAKAVHRDVHKMRAFVRFREVATDAGAWFVAWFEPQHFIVEANAPFFRDRFPNQRWSILTPDRCVHWDPNRRELSFAPGARREDAPPDDATEELWRTYYASIFNPARVKIAAMTAEMPKRYWKNLPEASLIPRLLADARPRVEGMVADSVAKAASKPAPPTP